MQVLFDKNSAGYWDGITCVMALTGSVDDHFSCYDVTVEKVDSDPYVDTYDDGYHFPEADVIIPYT